MLNNLSLQLSDGGIFVNFTFLETNLLNLSLIYTFIVSLLTKNLIKGIQKRQYLSERRRAAIRKKVADTKRLQKQVFYVDRYNKRVCTFLKIYSEMSPCYDLVRSMREYEADGSRILQKVPSSFIPMVEDEAFYTIFYKQFYIELFLRIQNRLLKELLDKEFQIGLLTIWLYPDFLYQKEKKV